MPKVSSLGLPPPSSDHQADGTRAFGSKLQTARCDHWQAHQLGNDGCKPFEPQRFFEGIENIFFADCFNKDDAIRMEADLRERWSKKVRACQAPNDLAFGSSRDTGHKERGCGSINRP
jgi:hypothetical protein